MRIPDVVLQAPLWDISGIAEAARNLYLNLFNLGVKVKLMEIPFWSHLKAEINPEVRDKLQHGFDRNDIQDPATIHFYPPHAVQQIQGLARVNVSYTLFETDKCPILWRDILNSPQFVENWVPCPFNLDSYSSMGVDRKKLQCIPLGVDTDKYNPEVPKMALNGAAPFVFMTSLDWSTRKNPEGMVMAFMQEFNNNPDVCLVIKSYTGYADEGSFNIIRNAIQKIRLISRSNAKVLFVPDFIHSDLMPSFHRAANCWVNLSRGEGWDMGALQSMACGIPVIGSDNTAHQSYLTEQTGYPVPCQKVAITNKEFLARSPQFIDHSWWEVDLKKARQAMRKAYEGRADELLKKGAEARKVALDFSWKLTAVRAISALAKYF